MNIRVMNKTRDSVLGSRVRLADTWWPRLRGFLFRPRPKAGQGMLLSPCRGVHMLGVPFPLDVLFLDRHGSVVAVYPGLRPGKVTAWHLRAEYALEVPEGTIAATGTRENDMVVWLPTESNADGAFRDERKATAAKVSTEPNGRNS
jgi:uncharacterized membrane protein (UPF0127 family)